MLQCNMDEMAHKTLKYRLDTLYFQIIDIHPNKRGDLKRIWKHAQKLWSDLDKEMVNCRRINKLTAHYISINDAMLESFDTLEQYLVWAKLTG